MNRNHEFLCRPSRGKISILHRMGIVMQKETMKFVNRIG